MELTIGILLSGYCTEDESCNLNAIHEGSRQHVRIRNDSYTAFELVTKWFTHSPSTRLYSDSSPGWSTDMYRWWVLTRVKLRSLVPPYEDSGTRRSNSDVKVQSIVNCAQLWKVPTPCNIINYRIQFHRKHSIFNYIYVYNSLRQSPAFGSTLHESLIANGFAGRQFTLIRCSKNIIFIHCIIHECPATIFNFWQMTNNRWTNMWVLSELEQNHCKCSHLHTRLFCFIRVDNY